MIVRATGQGTQFKIHSTCGKCVNTRCPCQHGFPLSKFFADQKWGGPEITRMLAENHEHRFLHHKRRLAGEAAPA